MHRAFASQTRPQAPQFAAPLMSTQVEPQRVQPAAQAIPHFPLAQVGVPLPLVGPGQILSHDPQWRTSSVTLTQLLPQATWLAPQLTEHVPLAQRVPD